MSDDIESRLRTVELSLAELRTEFNSLSGMIKLVIVLVCATLGIDMQEVL